MNLAISNIAWGKNEDESAYGLMQRYGFTGLEIAPTRVTPENPYDSIGVAVDFARTLRETYGFEIPSMQSILFGRSERLFGSPEERALLMDYLKKAVDFAAHIGCGNLVFGSPKNRIIDKKEDIAVAVEFFAEAGQYAARKSTTIAMEPNPVLYGTNFLNTTAEAIAFVRDVASPGFRINLDFGTMIENQEDISLLNRGMSLVNHIHISEPSLVPILERPEHQSLIKLCGDCGYTGFISIEMKQTDHCLEDIGKAMEYISRICG